MDNGQLPKGFISVEEGIKLIDSDSRDNAVVDMSYLISHIKWIEPKHNFRIPKIKPVVNEQGQVTGFDKIGSAYVYVARPFEAESLKEAIRRKYREETQREYDEQEVRGVSTVADDAQGKEAVKPRKNKPNRKAGESITEGGQRLINSADGSKVNV